MEIIENQDSTQQKKSTLSRSNYQNALDDYASGTGKFSNRENNPLYDIVTNSESADEAATRKRWEKAAAFTGLNTIIQSLGSIATASAGANPAPVNNSGFTYAIDQIEQSDKRARESYDKYYKAALSDSIRQNERTNDIEDNYLKGLNDIRVSDIAQEKFDAQIKQEIDTQQDKQQLELQKLSQSGKAATQTTNKQSVTEEKNEMYVFDSSGKRVPLKKEQVTKLHQIGKMYNIDGDYQNANNDFQRSREYDILIQRAYLLYEREKSQ
ncbi:MAG: hypothetical protein R3Y04_03720 [Rikenellaceae bacterium]